ncbi:insulinase family protein [Salinisphaera sp. USBA-960]|uniref:M16 family metallopeptidase n=1 Tax=Salinisphaera orenii TaxID=856731 RepID=UPI0013A6147C|nr:insulinase family protein [Salifodinibacter halophilus]NNC25420.1 insulinase family protein [Salifodinibacter halophilus]
MTALIAAPTFAKSGSSAASGDTKAATHTSNTARATLDNGLQVVAVANHLAPAVTTVMNYHVGSRQAPSGFPGMAHAQEHMMFRGTAKLSAAQISAIAAGMGGRFNASTQDELTQYYFSVPSKYLDVALHLQAARMKSVANKPEAWHKERGAIKKEVGRDLSNPGYVAYKKLREQLFHGTPYSHDALGTKPSFDKTTASMLNKFHDTWYAPNNATLVIAGDIKPEHVIDQVRHLFSSIQKKKLPKRTDLQFSPVKTKPIRMKTDRGQGMAYLAFRTPGTSDQKRYASLKVLTKILNDPRGRLYSQLVATGQSLGTSFATRGMRDAGIGFAAASFAKGADSKALVKKLKNVLSTIAEQGVTEQQVTAAKRQIKTAAAAAEDSISGQAQRWSRTVAMHQYQSPQALIQRIDRVDVERVNQLAKKLLAENAHVLTVLTPGKSDDATASSGFGGKESFTPKHVGKVKLPSWAAKPLQSIQAPAPTVQPQTTTLDNGMKLVTITTASTQATHVYGQIRNNPALTAPEGQAGVDSVLSRLLDFGTETHDRRAYQAALNRIGASSSAGTSFSLTVLPRHFQKGLSLLAEKQLQPALPAKAFPIVQRQIASAVAGQNQSPGFLAKQALKEGLYPKNDPSLRHATPKSVKSLTQGDVTSYYHKVFRPDLTTLVVVSSLPPQKVKQAVTKQFGDWSAKGNPPTVALDPVPANKPHRAQVDDSAKSQDEVALAQTLDVANKSRARHALQLGEQVLTGSFYASRLYRELRAERGLVYTIGSNINLSPKRATLSFQFGAAPEHVEQADQIIRETLTNMAEEPINTEDLHRARAGLIRQIPLQAASASSIGNGILRRERLDLPLDAPYRAADDYLDIGAKTIQQAFKTYVRPNDLVRIVQGPAPVDDN